MLKKLRVKFIIITMVSIIAVLSAIMVTVNTVSYLSVIKSADKVVDLLCQNDGAFPYRMQQDSFGVPDQRREESFSPEPKDKNYVLPKDMSEETPFDTRFFTVYFSDDAVAYTSMDRIAAVTEEEAEKMAIEVVSKNKTKGTYDIYRYRVVTKDNGEKMVLFMDISRQLAPMNSFLTISIIVMAVCFVIFLVVIILISKPVLRPIAESYRRQKRFITDAGHELKTPLTIISANNELQEMETGETECTQAISKQVLRMTSMVKNLTELAKMDEEEMLGMKHFDLSAAFEDVVSSFKNVFEKNNKSLSVRLQNGISYYGVESMLRRLVTLLMENALKYSVSHAEVEVSKKGKKILFLVKNDAKGVSEGDQSKCFERFYRSDEARAGQEGSGIGLSTAQEIVRLHKGKISATGTSNGDFVITVLL